MDQDQSQEAKSQSNEQPEHSRSANDNTVQTTKLVKNTVDVVSSAMSNFQSILNQQLENTKTMTQEINKMFIDTIKSNVKITSVLSPVQGGIELSATVSNISSIPIVNASTNLSFGLPEDRRNSVTWQACSATITTEQPERQPASVTLDNDKVITLMGHSQYTQIVHIKTNELLQCNGTLELEFPPPIKAETVRLQHRFGVYLIDQLTKKVVKDASPAATEYKHQDREYPATFLRNILDLHPMQGMEPGMKIILSPIHAKMDIEISCTLNEFKHDCSIVSVRFSANDSALPFLGPLLRELDLLKVC